MFGRRRHAAAEVQAAPVPQLTDAQILEVVHTKIAELIGESGEWTVSRRSTDDTDSIFHSVLAQSVSVGITAALVEARRRLEAGEATVVVASEPQHRAPAEPVAIDAPAVAEEQAHQEQEQPAAFGWEPAPITVWTDLRKPVTGELPAIAERSAA
ncbi:hypothetical protein [Leifsonia shinshuensis]|uniref:Uncharacterized protein n=1 Tax=Leifsonia shinshuensis TaxID=150026 RepID=A0A853CV00_9MICO|nr:hypothetical protein [Leifsonia shinshuensis]NYJ24497.1 hypothetical protein [Leifsonia shinshuensis]